MSTRTLETGGLVCLVLGLTLSVGSSVSSVMQARLEPDGEGLASLQSAVRLRQTGQLREFDARIAGLRAYADDGDIRLERALASVASVRRVEEQSGVTAATDEIIVAGVREAQDALSSPPSRWAAVNTAWISGTAAVFTAIGLLQIGVAQIRRRAQQRRTIQALGLGDVDDDAIADEVALHSIRLRAQRTAGRATGDGEGASRLRVVEAQAEEKPDADPFGSDTFRPTRRRG